MNIQEIATACVDALDPGLSRSIESHASSTHPEIVNGRRVMIDKRNRMIATVSQSIGDAVTAERLCAQMVAEKLAMGGADLIGNHSPASVIDMREAIALWKSWKAGHVIPENSPDQPSGIPNSNQPKP